MFCCRSSVMPMFCSLKPREVTDGSGGRSATVLEGGGVGILAKRICWGKRVWEGLLVRARSEEKSVCYD